MLLKVLSKRFLYETLVVRFQYYINLIFPVKCNTVLSERVEKLDEVKSRLNEEISILLKNRTKLIIFRVYFVGNRSLLSLQLKLIGFHTFWNKISLLLF